MDIVVKEKREKPIRKKVSSEQRSGFVGTNLKKDTYDIFEGMYDKLIKKYTLKKWQLMHIAIEYLKDNGGVEKVKEILEEKKIIK